MAVIGGRGGHISKGSVGGGSETAIPCVRTWGMSYSAALQELVCSASKGAKIRVDGNLDWTGTYNAYGPTPALFPGDKFEFEGAIVDGSASDGKGVKGDAICESIAITIDIEAAAAISHVVAFGADGDLTLGASITVPADLSVPNPFTAKGLKVEIAADPFTSWNEIHEARTLTLTMSKANTSYVSSGTGGQTRRMEGNLDVVLALTCYAAAADGWASFPQPNSIYAVRVYTTASLFWLIKWLKTGELGGMEVDVETGSLVGASLNMALTAFTGGVEGIVQDPASATKWPV